jgi:DNA-binding LytR/AlgR family response regulator
MPGINGFELARRARAPRPSLAAAYLTGQSHLPPDSAGEAFGPILRKPCQRDDLTRQVEESPAPIEDAHLVKAVALEMMHRHADALSRAKEPEELD